MSAVRKPRVVAIIPARAGSKGIPRKNMRILHGKPLIWYAISNALESGFITDVVVTSDSQEVLGYASQFDGVAVVSRGEDISGDRATLDPVIADALQKSEQRLGCKFDIVVTLQATSPLLTVQTLDTALKQFAENGSDTCLSVVNNPHLSWAKDDAGRIVPNYAARKNRQELPPNYVETGAFLITKRENVTPSSRIGENVTVYEMPVEEAIDIDTLSDWAACESALGKKSIVFRVDGYRELGMGHIYRALTLAYHLTGHDVSFVCNSRYSEGIALLQEANMKVVEVKNDEELFSWLQSEQPDIFVNDLLDTDREYIEKLKLLVPRVVTFEDLGSGARHADAVVNALYEKQFGQSDIFYCGEDYVCLRDEFLISEPKEFCEEVRNVFVMFGGADPLDLTSKVYDLALRENADGIRYDFDFVLGLPYSNPDIIDNPEKGIKVHRDLVRVSDIMKKADVAFTSQGRSVFELTVLGIPSIVMAQNPRETTHYFAEMGNGFINLGLGSSVDNEDLMQTFEWLVRSAGIRREMRALMLSKKLKTGIHRVREILLGEFREGGENGVSG